MWILKPVRLDRCSGARQFILRLLAQQFILKSAIAVFIGLFASDLALTDHSEIFRRPVEAFVLMVLVAPVLETLLTQSLPIGIVRALKQSRLVQFLAGSVPFAALHFIGGVGTGIAAGMVGGIFFSHAYLEGRERSRWTAIWITAVLHSLHNLVVFPLAFIFQD